MQKKELLDWLYPVWKRKNVDKTIDAVARTNNQATLKKIALCSPVMQAREQACAKIEDMTFLVKLAAAVPELNIRSAAAYTPRDIDGLLALLAESNDITTSQVALEHLCLALGYERGTTTTQNLATSLIQCAAARCKSPCTLAHVADALDYRFPGVYQEVLTSLAHCRADDTEPVDLPLSPAKTQRSICRPIVWLKQFLSGSLFFYLYCLIAFVVYTSYLQVNGFSFSIRPPEPPLSAVEIAFLLLLMLPVWAMLFARIRKIIRD